MPTRNQGLEYERTTNETKRPNALVRAFNSVFRRRQKEKTSAVSDENTTDTGHIGSYAKSPNLAGWYCDAIQIEANRSAKYRDYDRMCGESVIYSRGLDIIVKNIFMSKTGNQYGFEVKSDNTKYEKILNDMNERLDLHKEFPEIVKVFMKYGDSFDEVVYDNNRNIVRVKFLNPYNMLRQEDEYGRLMEDNAFIMVDEGDSPIAGFQEWQVIHHRYNRKRGNLYGTGKYEVGRRYNRILHFMEDGVAINRMSRAYDRLLFKVPIPRNAPKDEVDIIMAEAERKMRRRPNVDDQGNLDLNKAPYGDDEDFFMSQYEEGVQPDIVKIAGSSVIGQLNDVEYFQNMNVMVTGIPKAYFGLERDVNAKATLEGEDLQYARTLRYDQSECARWYVELATRQLQAQGLIVEQNSIEVVFPPISFIDEQVKATVQKLKWEIAVVANGLGLPMDWILENIVELSAEDLDNILPNLRPSTPQLPGEKEPTKSESEEIRRVVFSNQGLAKRIAELKDILYFIDQESLGRNVTFTGPKN